MSKLLQGKRKFSESERYAIFLVHNEKCYLCGKPVDLLSMEVDHIIPDSLGKAPAELAAVLAAFGKPDDFDLQSYANLAPSCGPCNARKNAMRFDATPLVQLELQRAAEKADKVRLVVCEVVARQTVTKGWNAIRRAYDGEALGEELIEEILAFATFVVAQREQPSKAEALRLTPLIHVLSEGGGLRIVKGTYGVGAGPIGSHVHSSFYCGYCGSNAWSGPRCVVCGQLSDD